MNAPLSDSIIIPLFFIGFLLIVIHIPLFMIITIFWITDQMFKKNLATFEELDSIAKDLGIINHTFPPQKGLSLLSWMVYNKRITDHYLPFINILKKARGESKLKLRQDSLIQYFYGTIFGHQSLTNVLSTEPSAEPFIMVSTKRISERKSNFLINRTIYLKSKGLNLPHGSVERSLEFLSEISPDKRDINFISDEQFSKKFDLIGEDIPKIRTLFNQKVRNILLNNPEWIMKFKNNEILITYQIKKESYNSINDIRPTLKEVSTLHQEIQSIDLDYTLSEEEINLETPEEFIDENLYKRRMKTFGFAIGCSTVPILFGFFGVFGAFVRLDIKMLLVSLIVSVPGVLMFLWGKLEWVRNKKLKSDGKVKNV